MIKSFYEAGRLLSQLDVYKDYFSPWANPFPKVRGEPEVLIAHVRDGQLVPDLDPEKFKTELVDKYLFREAKANATNLVPTFYLQVQADADKQAESVRKMMKKVRASVANYEHTFITTAQLDTLETMLQTKAATLSSTTSYLFTMKIDDKWFGDYPANVDLFMSDAYRKYSDGSAGQNQVCAVTYQPADEVWGRVDTLGFAVTDVAFARNGFNTADSYKMFPVSPDVVKVLEGAKRLLLEKLARNFYGMKYLVMPRFIQAVEERNALKLWRDFLDDSDTAYGTMSAQFKPLISNERLISKILEREQQSNEAIYYDIFFYQPNNAQFMIKLHVSDVLPSRFREIMQAKETVDESYRLMVDQLPVFEEGKLIKGKTVPFEVTFAAIKDYFAKKVRTDWVFHPYFFRIVEAVFYKQRLDHEQLMRAFMDTIRVSFKNSHEQPYQFSRDVRHTFVILQFFYQLKLLSFSDMADIEPATPQPVGLTLETFELQHPDLLSDPIRRAAFYLGVEVEMLLAKQQAHYKTQPFRKYLNGLNLDMGQLAKVHHKLLDKVAEYASVGANDKRRFYPNELNRMTDLDRDILPVLMQPNNSLSMADLSYAFAAGMAMQKVFTLDQIRLNKQKKDNQTTNQTDAE